MGSLLSKHCDVCTEVCDQRCKLWLPNGMLREVCDSCYNTFVTNQWMPKQRYLKM